MWCMCGMLFASRGCPHDFGHIPLFWMLPVDGIVFFLVFASFSLGPRALLEANLARDELSIFGAEVLLGAVSDLG